MFNFFMVMLLVTPFSSALWAQGGQVTSPTCHVHIPKTVDKDMNEMLDVASKELRKRGFEIKVSDFTQPLGPGQFYFQFSREFETEGLYPPCKASVLLQETENSKISPKDKEIFRYSTRRSLPRTTPKSLSRCKLALRDAFEFFPTCLKREASLEP